MPVFAGLRAVPRCLVDLQRVERRGAGKPPGGFLVVHLERAGWRGRLVARDRVRVARPYLLCRLSQAIRRRHRFRDDEASRRPADVVVEGRGAVYRRFILRRCAAVHQDVELVGQRADRHVVQRRHGSLRRGIEAAERLDVVADELRPDRKGLPRRKHVHHPAAAAELAVRLDRIAAREAGVHQTVGQLGRRAGSTEAEIHGREQQSVRRADARQERHRRRDDDSRVAEGQRRQGAAARRGHVQMRGHAAVRVHLGRGKHQHAALRVAPGEPFQPGQEEPDVRRRAVDVRIARNHDDHRPEAGEDGRRQRLDRRGQTADRPAGRGRAAPETGAGGRLVEQGAKRQRCGG